MSVAVPRAIVMPWRPPMAAGPCEPISTVIALIAYDAAFAITASFAVAETIAAATPFILAAGVVGAQYLLSSQPDGSGHVSDFGGSALQSQEVRINTRQPTPHRRVIYGRALVGGALALEKVVPPYLYHLWLDAAHEIEGYEELRIGRDRLVFSTVEPVLPAGTLAPIGKLEADGTVGLVPDYPGNLLVSVGNGEADQVIDPMLAAAFPDLASTFRQRGIARRALRYKYPGTNFNDFQEVWGSVRAPNCLALVKGRKVYDPRDPTQIMWSDSRDAAEVEAAEATWKWSNTAALVQADYAVQPFGGRIKPAKMRYDKVADAASYDDELVGTTTEGEMIRRHTIDGVVTLNQPPVEVMRQMLSANRGFIVQRAGSVWVQSSRPLESMLTIHDGILVDAIEFQGFKPKRDLVNRVFSRFIATEREYQQVDGPTLDRTDLQDTDGEILTATLGMPFTLDHRRVQRLQKAYLDSARLGKTLNCTISLRGLTFAHDELICARVTVDSDLFAAANGSYRVLNMGFADNFASVPLFLAEYDPDIERDWVAADDEQEFTVAELDLG